MQKRGQFFILAAVILSALLFSLAFTTNYVVANPPDRSFFDYADTIERETSEVLDYQVYTDVAAADLEGFVAILESDFRDRELGANFMVLYGNTSRFVIKNLGAQGITIDGEERVLTGATTEVVSTIRVGGVGSLGVVQYNTENTEAIVNDLDAGDEIAIRFNEHIYSFAVSDVNQVIFIVHKDVGEETYVEVR